MKTDLIKSIGLELADIRRTKELSIVDVAKNTNINKDTISNYENGNSSMKVYILDILLTYYGLNIANFFTKVYDRMHNKTLIQELEEYQEGEE